MKKFSMLVIAVAMMASCSAPKYAYHFDHYDYNSGKKNKGESLTALPGQHENVFAVDQETMVASADEKLMVIAENPVSTREAASKTYKGMSKTERKEFRKELKEDMKNYSKALKSGDHVAAAAATKAMDHDLKLAIIFGAVGVTLNLFGGVNSVFWILGVIAIVIGVVFFIKWISRQ
ncbi:MAG: hypothetical protein JNM57_17300 [Cyclobacteriaceae bacterium]|nr:hypothetical protein [Cyclobacteriaceae bacterium]